MKENDVGSVYVGNKEIWLTKFNGGDRLNIYSQVRSFDIYESLDNNTIVADFYLADGIELPNEYPLGGEERISVSLQTPGRSTITYDFLIESIQGMKSNDQSNMRSYVLRCVTEDFLKNSCTVYTKRYMDMNYDDAVQMVIETDLEAKIPLLTVEATKGKFDYVVNAKRPFQVIDLIKERAVSGEGYKSSAFVFYQDNQGYHFQTIEKLIKDRKPGAEGKQFYYETGNRSQDYEKVINVRNILTYETMSQGKQIEKVARGAMRTQIREFDIYTGTYYTKNEYINSSDHKIFEATDDNYDLNSPDFNGFTSKLPAITRMAVKDGLRPEMEHNKNIHYQRPFMERITQYGVRVRVYGDTNLRVGDIVKLNIPQIYGHSGEGKPKKSEIFSENYIVTALKHRCDMSEKNDFQHYIIMECRKPNQFAKELG